MFPDMRSCSGKASPAFVAWFQPSFPNGSFLSLQIPAMPFSFSSLARKRKHTKEPEIFDNEEQEERQVLTTVYRAENPVIEWVASAWTELTCFIIFSLFPSIVAVHGLNGDAIKSFTSGKNQKFWLGDTDMLPADLANCRILTFSYPASVAAVFGKTSSETILQHATTLVHELVADRQVKNTPFAPSLAGRESHS